MTLTPRFVIELALKEYEMLRAEMLRTVERQYALVNWGVSAVAVITAAIVGGWGTLNSIPGIMSAILVLIIPAIMTAYVIAWSHVITKINQLGSRLYEIEENVAKAFDSELIYKTYSINSPESYNPYKYTIGWEHRLWKNGVNLRIQTTIWIVRIALAGIYTTFVILNIFFLIYRNIVPLYIWGSTIIAGIFWGCMLLLVFRYLHHRTLE
jgi:hypothetical protein